MTGETSPCQQQPTLLWPTDLSDGWICAGTLCDRGPPGDQGEGGGLTRVFRNLASKSTFLKMSLRNYCLPVRRGLRGFEMWLGLF